MTRAFPGRRFGADDDAMFVASQDTPVELCVHRRQWDACDECKADHEAELVALELAASEKIRNRENG